MHPLSSTMERQQSQVDIMGDIKKEQYGSSNSLDKAERKRYVRLLIIFVRFSVRE